MEESNKDNESCGGDVSPLSPKLIRLALPVVILVFGFAVYAILSREPEEKKRPKALPRAIKTRVAELALQDYETVVRTQGIVRPYNEVTLTAQVSGRIVKIMPEFEDGAFFNEGDVLLELDETDFQTAVIAARAALARSKTVFAQEQTRANQARLNWEDLGYDEEPNELVLRLPQLREAEANVKSSEAQLARAETDLKRAKVRAPYSGRVRQRIVGLGQTIGGATPLGTIFAIDFAEVRLPIAGRDMAFLTLPEETGDPAVEVRLRDALNEANDTVWKAQIIRTEGVLDEITLELFAIARIVDPFGRQSGQPPLRIGHPVVGFIPGKVLKDVYAIPRVAVRKLENIFLVDKSDLTLSQLTISPIFSDEDYLIVRHPAITLDKYLATTHLIYAPDGAKAEILPEVGDEPVAQATEVAPKAGAKKST
ncbi:MAG: Multidrug resistance protein MdtA [Verrucomicrobia subdivision 3 bacterium]|nr:Multidrug resistance protein MdtA [Limisphaerales bacterium]MCS1415218.1 Multidrug resistance protein MdtA [Limisphaerales bacterium]